MTPPPANRNRKAIIGTPPNFWIYTTTHGFDLTRPTTLNPETATTHDPRLTLIPTTTTTTTTTTKPKPITIAPSKTALVIIDMQNFFISPHLPGRSKDSAGLRAAEKLLGHAIPAARKAGIRVVWLNWGLSEEDLRDGNMPPGTARAFGYETVPEDFSPDRGLGVRDSDGDGDGDGEKEAARDDYGVNGGVKDDDDDDDQESGRGEGRTIYRGLGSPIGPVTIPVTPLVPKKNQGEGGEGKGDGKGEEETKTETVDGGRLLFRDQWNSALPPDLDAAYREGLQLPDDGKRDVWIHKNRMSGFWGGRTAVEEFLDGQGIRTLLFGGVNTDQCVGGSFQDAFSKGYDCLLLSDGCGTTSPGFAQDCIEFNAAKTWGFVLTCEDFAKGVEAMEMGG